MNKKIAFPTILFAVIALVSVAVLATNKGGSRIENNPANQNAESSDQNGIVLFYGDGCPHCALVEKYIDDNSIEAKVSFTKKEVYYNKDNASDLTAKAKTCGMATDSIGVPFLWDGSTCLVGDQPIIDFFKQKAGQ